MKISIRATIVVNFYSQKVDEIKNEQVVELSFY